MPRYHWISLRLSSLTGIRISEPSTPPYIISGLASRILRSSGGLRHHCSALCVSPFSPPFVCARLFVPASQSSSRIRMYGLGMLPYDTNGTYGLGYQGNLTHPCQPTKPANATNYTYSGNKGCREYFSIHPLTGQARFQIGYQTYDCRTRKWYWWIKDQYNST